MMDAQHVQTQHLSPPVTYNHAHALHEGYGQWDKKGASQLPSHQTPGGMLPCRHRQHKLHNAMKNNYAKLWTDLSFKKENVCGYRHCH